ncbi:MAG: tRNA (adenosine(37)-N6)-threonylcarbamoyltransferase complex transferase subunit TsaD [Calditrichaeota bacterium]|nr:MAG: tRNA (adenosine(37)-N6)-threonylcarbamoyltransferase complex transferase subunit TsaD [Calditrichota bacterium]
MKVRRILGVETSCDETSAAVLEEGRVLSSVISSQWVHQQFGGVVPELASRAHLRKIVPIVQQALQKAALNFSDLDGFAVTYGPGLVGALLVGVNYVKGLSLALGKPFVGVNHIEGHIYSNFLENEQLEPPFLCLIVSGGHTQIILVQAHLTYRILGETRDDAVGEAFDKVAKLLGLPYPGGPHIDRLARDGNPDAIPFPRALRGEDTLDFSYSGLKTAVLNYLQALTEEEKKRQLADICASFQMAAVEVLVERTIRAARRYQVRQIAVAGGVAANSLLRSLMTQEAKKFHLLVYFPPLKYCTDNAAMIARAGLEHLKAGRYASLDLNAIPYLRIDGKES